MFGTGLKVLLGVLGVILSVFIVGISIFYVENHPLNLYNGQVLGANKKHGLVTVFRDQFGIPTVHGDNMASCAYGIGYVHGTDRQWQMHLTRMAATGRLSEMFGSDLVDQDKYMRLIGLRRAAIETQKLLTDEAREVLQAYADGVNLAVEEKLVPPVEFLLPGTQWEPWQVVDTVTYMKLMFLMLTYDWSYEPMREVLREKYGHQIASRMVAATADAAFRETFIINEEEMHFMGLFDQSDWKQKGTSSNDRQKEQQTKSEKATDREDTNQNKTWIDNSLMDILNTEYWRAQLGSNAWVVSGQHTKSGQPLIANDPHLETCIPSIWMQAQLVFNQKVSPQKSSRYNRAGHGHGHGHGHAHGHGHSHGQAHGQTGGAAEEGAAGKKEESCPHHQQQQESNNNSTAPKSESEGTGTTSTTTTTTHVIGGSMPGCPFIFSGKTPYFAWTVTTLYADSSDLLYVTLNEQGDKYFYENQWLPIREQKEIIRVRGEEQGRVFIVKSTHQGPIMTHYLETSKDESQSEALTQEEEDERSGEGSRQTEKPKAGNQKLRAYPHPMALMWPGHVANDTIFTGLLRAAQAETVEEVQAAFHLVTGPPQAITFATSDGHIGFFGCGRLPVRKHFRDNGFVRNGSFSENEWERFMSPQEQPRLVDPAKGYIVTANNKYAPDQVVGHTTLSSADTPRAFRITQMIQKQISLGEKFSVDSFQLMQSDVKDAYAVLIKSQIRDLWQTAPLRREAVDSGLLSSIQAENIDLLIRHIFEWNGKATKKSYGAAIYYVWEYFFSKNLLHDFDRSGKGKAQSEFKNDEERYTMSWIFDSFLLQEIERLYWIFVQNKTNNVNTTTVGGGGAASSSSSSSNSGWWAASSLDEKYCQGNRHLKREQSLGRAANLGFFQSRGCLFAFTYALKEANAYLVKKFGVGMTEGAEVESVRLSDQEVRELFQWGKVHVHRLPHKVFTKVGGMLGAFFERHFESGGSRRTVDVSVPDLQPSREERLFSGMHSGNYKMVADLSNAVDSESFFIIDTGVSESPFSPFYDNQLQLYRQQNYIKMKEGLYEAVVTHQFQKEIGGKIGENQSEI